MIELDKIYNEDCLEGIRKIDNETIDLIVIDPPYGKVVNADWDKGENPFTLELIKELYRVLNSTGSLYIWCGIGEKSQSLISFFNIMTESKFYFKDLITWKKQRGIGMRKGWLYTREECLWYVKDNKQFIWNKENQYSEEKRLTSNKYTKYLPKSEYKRITNVWDDISEATTGRQKKQKHLTPKPVMAIERIINLHTQQNDVVLDCFIGSGTTAIACINTNRKYIGFELDTNYYEIAQNRIAEALKFQR